ncbi:MAG: M23 family metallopeptidase [Spongiibacteraceae bacterium]
MKRLCVLLLAFFAGPVLAEFTVHGPRVQGGLMWGQVAPGDSVRLGGKAVSIAADGSFVFGVGRDAAARQLIEFCDAIGKCVEQELLIEQREYRVQRVNGVPQKTVTPPTEVLQRIREEGAMVRRARSQSLDRRDYKKTLNWPLLGPITGVFGSQRVYNGTPGRPHYGVDVAGPVGAIVRAPLPGVVTLVHRDMFYSGGTLIVDHGQGVSSTFIHLSKVLVTVGQELEQGQVMAEVGATGRATGPHLDWRMNWFSERLDPALLLGPMPDIEKSNTAP